MNIEELRTMLEKIEDSYDNFVLAMLQYASKKESRAEMIMAFIKTHPDASSSDVIELVSKQEDFYDDMIYPEKIELVNN